MSVLYPFSLSFFSPLTQNNVCFPISAFSRVVPKSLDIVFTSHFALDVQSCTMCLDALCFSLQPYVSTGRVIPGKVVLGRSNNKCPLSLHGRWQNVFHGSTETHLSILKTSLFCTGHEFRIQRWAWHNLYTLDLVFCLPSTVQWICLFPTLGLSFLC